MSRDKKNVNVWNEKKENNDNNKKWSLLKKGL